MAEQSSTEAPKKPTQETQPILMADFLEGVPPSQMKDIQDLSIHRIRGDGLSYYLHTPELELHCNNDRCNGVRIFRSDEDIYLTAKKWRFAYVTYKCSNCQEIQKTFSLGAYLKPDTDSGRCFKFGEFPAYGPPTPARLITLLGPDRDLFLRGRRCENQGLGIGAFVYYRRVVENQKGRIFDNVIKVAEKIGASTDLITALIIARDETQFSKSLEMAKDAMPPSLLINGYNPFTLLHSALSDGLHDKSEEHCLEIAHDVRVVLAELAESLAQALKDEAELNTAISRLLKR